MTMHDQAAVSTAPIACTLSAPEQRERREALGEGLFGGVEQVWELNNGYAFRFPGDADQATEILRFIAAERECCPFFTFELLFEPDRGPLWLRVRGPEGAKAFIHTMMVG